MTLKNNKISKNKFDILLYQNAVIKTYLFLIKGNIRLIKNLLKKQEKIKRPYNQNKLFYARSLHLQTMLLIGTTAEHLIKLILLKRKYILNKTNKVRGLKKNKGVIINKKELLEHKFSDEFFNKLLEFNKLNNPSQKQINKIYLKAKKDIKNDFFQKTFDFKTCIELFLRTNKYERKNYLSHIKRYKLNSFSKRGIRSKRYLKKFDNLNKHNCLTAIRLSRNNYVHMAEAKSEQKGVILYMINYLITVAKEEFKNEFQHIRLVGNQDIKKLFEKNATH